MQKSRGEKLWYAKQRCTWKIEKKKKSAVRLRESTLSPAGLCFLPLPAQNSTKLFTTHELKAIRRKNAIERIAKTWSGNGAADCRHTGFICLWVDDRHKTVSGDRSSVFQCLGKTWDIHVKCSCCHRCRQSCQNVKQKLSLLRLNFCARRVHR